MAALVWMVGPTLVPFVAGRTAPRWTPRTGDLKHEAPRKMLAKLLWTQETCNPMPSFEVSWNPVGPGLKYDPTVPDAPVLKEAEPM